MMWQSHFLHGVVQTEFTTFSKCMFQVMDELDLTHFRHGGVNITGFRLLDRDNPKIRTIEQQWLKLSHANPLYWKGAGIDRSIGVTIISLYNYIKIIAIQL